MKIFSFKHIAEQIVIAFKFHVGCSEQMKNVRVKLLQNVKKTSLINLIQTFCLILCSYNYIVYYIHDMKNVNTL